jgi:hypothetical protein
MDTSWRAVGVIALALSFIGCTIVPVIPERTSLRAPLGSLSPSGMFDSEEVADALGIPGIELASADSVVYTPNQRQCSKGKKHPLKKFLKQIENTIDDPIDDIKHTLHGIRIMRYKIYLPSFLMKGGSNTCR